MRFIQRELGDLTREEGLEAVFNYSIITGVPVAEDVAVYLNELVDSDPFYISAVIRSTYENEIDVWAKGFEEGNDLLITVKSQEDKVGQSQVEEFLKAKVVAEGMGMKGHYIFYSSSGFTEAAKELLCKQCIMYADRDSLHV